MVWPTLLVQKHIPIVKGGDAEELDRIYTLWAAGRGLFFLRSGLRPSLRKNKPPLQGLSLVETIATCYCNLPFLKNAQFTGNVEMAGFDPKEVFNTYRCLNISLSITDAEILGLKVSPEGYAYLFLNEQTFYLISPEKLNYDAIVYRKWMEENAWKNEQS